MKKSILLVAMLSVAGLAQAESGTVTITGEIVNGACGLSADSVDKTVQLGKVPVHVFKGAANNRSTPVKFDLVLTDCDTTISNAVNIKFTGAQNPVNPELLAVVGSATGVGVRLQAPNGADVVMGTPTADVSLSDGDNTLRFTAAYQSVNATVTAGTADAIAQFDLNYN